MRALLDTCIIVDVLQNREPFYKAAQSIFIMAANQQFTGYITAKSVTDIYYLTHKLTHSDKASREIISKLFKLFDVLDTSGIDCKKAILSPMSDYEDAVMIETADREEIDCVVTRNICDYKESRVKVLTPEAFLEEIRK